MVYAASDFGVGVVSLQALVRRDFSGLQAVVRAPITRFRTLALDVIWYGTCQPNDRLPLVLAQRPPPTVHNKPAPLQPKRRPHHR
jgi:hypothetical protein